MPDGGALRSPALAARSATAPITEGLTAMLRERAAAVTNARHRIATDRAVYLTWVHETAGMLRHAFTPAAVSTLLRTPTYWAALTPTDASAGALHDAVLAEVEDVSLVLDALAAHLDAERQSWAPVGSFVIPDTSVYMTDTEITERDWYELTNTRRMTRLRLVVPMLVVDELDNLKDRGPDNTKKHARRNLKLFREAFAHGPSWRHEIPAPQAVRSDAWNVDMRLLTEPLEYERLGHNDSELIRQALWLQQITGRPVSIVSRDTGQVFRAQAQGLAARHVDA